MQVLDRADDGGRSSASRSPWRHRALTGGGAAGNEQLTSAVGLILIVMLAVVGVSIPDLRQLIWMHLFVGFLLLGPVAVKMASTGYRFVRYYTHNSAYRAKGPPELFMRLIAPIVVISTVVVFVSGIVLLFDGPGHRGQWLLIHKVSFIVWIAFMVPHILGHLLGMGRSFRTARANAAALGASPGAAGRWISVAGGLVGGLVLALVLIPHFAPWTGHGVFMHHHHRG
jgi:hypothetical protein